LRRKKETGRPLLGVPRFYLFFANFGKHASLKRKRARRNLAAPGTHRHELVAIVIVVIPIAIRMPPVAVFVPPTAPLVPAAFPRLVQFMTRMIRLPAVPTVMLDGLVQLMIRLGDAALTTIVILGGHPGCSRECQHSQKRRRYEQGPS